MCFKPCVKGAINGFSLLKFDFRKKKETKRREKMRTEKLSNNNGNELCKRHRSVGQKVEIANTLHTILCKIEPSKEKPQTYAS